MCDEVHPKRRLIVSSPVKGCVSDSGNPGAERAAKQRGTRRDPEGLMRQRSCSAHLFVPQNPAPCVRLESCNFPHTPEAALGSRIPEEGYDDGEDR
jgi:hypothetical protein